SASAWRAGTALAAVGLYRGHRGRTDHDDLVDRYGLWRMAQRALSGAGDVTASWACVHLRHRRRVRDGARGVVDALALRDALAETDRRCDGASPRRARTGNSAERSAGGAGRDAIVQRDVAAIDGDAGEPAFHHDGGGARSADADFV